MQREVVVVSGVRTAIGDFGGSLKDFAPTELGARVVREVLSRAQVSGDEVGHVVFGNVVHTEPKDMYLARVAAINGGIAQHAPALTVNRLCGSGLQAIVSAAQNVLLGDADIAVAGGAENMSRAPYSVPAARFGQRMGDAKLVDMMIGALNDPFQSIHMGVTAENVAAKYGITRDAQDALALESHRRASHATKSGYFKDQILPIEIASRKGTVVFDADEHVRHDASLDDFTKLKPVFAKENGTVTAGNASGVNDGACALLVASEAAARRHGLVPRARVLGIATAGVEPRVMGIGPAPATQKLLARLGMTLDQFDVIELNEAFASQGLAVLRLLGVADDDARVNPNGGAIALGHPLGASGARLVTTATYQLHRTGGRFALCTMCIGVGQGIAIAIERV